MVRVTMVTRVSRVILFWSALCRVMGLLCWRSCYIPEIPLKLAFEIFQIQFSIVIDHTSAYTHIVMHGQS